MKKKATSTSTAVPPAARCVCACVRVCVSSLCLSKGDGCGKSVTRGNNSLSESFYLVHPHFNRGIGVAIRAFHVEACAKYPKATEHRSQGQQQRCEDDIRPSSPAMYEHEYSAPLGSTVSKFEAQLDLSRTSQALLYLNLSSCALGMR